LGIFGNFFILSSLDNCYFVVVPLAIVLTEV
jgi:hypothetical protein